MSVNLTFLGSGTSLGVPIIGCRCPVCTSTDPRNKRTRASVWLRFHGKSVLIDTAPELRLQALTNGISRVDALLYTHVHADHVFGFDDIRRFNQMQREVIPVYGSEETLSGLRELFGYAFDPKVPNWNVPQVASHVIEGPFQLFGLTIHPITVMHGSTPVTAYRLRDLAYVTDCSHIAEEQIDALRDLDVLVLDALRYEPHPKHFSLEEALSIVERLRPARTYLTHLSHAFDHATVERLLPKNVYLAYDGLCIQTDS